MKRILYTLTTLLLFTALTFAQPDQPWLQKIDPVLLDQARNGEALDMLLLFEKSASLGEARFIRGKSQKATYIYNLLREHATVTQREAITFLRQQKATFQSYWITNAIHVKCNESTMFLLAQLPSVQRIIENSEMQSVTPIDESPSSTTSRSAVEWGIDRINADDVWALGYSGQGVVVGGQDTGYEWDHPALKRRYRGYIETADTVDHNYNWHDAIHQYDTLHNDTNNICGLDVREPCDDSGHGTHTMGTMIGQDTNRMIGVAPDAVWCGCRNMERGYGRLHTYLECFQWFIAPTDLNNENPDPSKSPHVINNSWGCPPIEGCNASNWHILNEAVEASRLAGIVVVASAGNSGSSCGSVSSPPAIFEGTFSVGATAINDTIAGFSSRGPVTVDSSFRVKPNVSAPGVGILSARPGGGYGNSSGTSMAGPHVAGTVALIIAANPTLAGEVELIEDIIEQTAIPKTTDQQCGDIPGSEVPNNTYGYGRIDALAAVELALITTSTTDETASAISIYPNPAKDFITISAAIAYGEVQCNLVDIHGKVLQRQLLRFSGGPLQSLSLPGYAPGIYFLHLLNDNVHVTAKFIIRE